MAFLSFLSKKKSRFTTTSFLKGVILRPGPARSRLEALAYVDMRPCPTCGAASGASDSDPADPGDAAVWEVRASCCLCATIARYLFDAGPGWPEAGTNADGSADPHVFAARFGPPGTRSAILTEGDLIRLRDRALGQFQRYEEELAENPQDQMTPRLVAHAAASALRPMIELDLITRCESPLPADPDPQRAHLLDRLRAIGKGQDL